MLVGVFERVYEVGPVFRAEPHDTSRHLAEYVSLDAELGFIEDHRTVMGVAREAVAGMVEGARQRAGRSLELLGVRLPDVPAAIPTLHFAEAQERIEQATSERAVGEPDLAPAHERWLGEWARREHGADFLFVEGYPMAKRLFYTHPEPGRPEYSNSFDLLFRGLELMTGGQRLHRYDEYLAALAARGQSPESPSRGICRPSGTGCRRTVASRSGSSAGSLSSPALTTFRKATLFPRDRGRLAP